MFVFKTPLISDDLRQISFKGYENILQHTHYFPNPKHQNLWGTETLAGDWDGRLLIVAKDFAPTEYLKSRSDNRPPYSHTIEKSQTNKNLVEFIDNAGWKLDLAGKDNTSCGILYISACFLLKQDHALRTSISKGALEKSWPAVTFTIKHMPKLTDIVLCGTHAFDSFRYFGKVFNEARRNFLHYEVPTIWSWGGRTFNIHLTCHPTQVAVNAFGREANQRRWNKIIKSAFSDH